MRAVLTLILICSTLLARAQVRIHAHNDYLNQQPFSAAFYEGAWSFEADIFLQNGQIMVAHTRDEINPEATLDKLYLQQAVALLKQQPGRTAQLMIDVKDNFNAIYPVLLTLLKPYFKSFKGKVRIVISGNRPDPSTFRDYPKEIFFDGIPVVRYAAADLKKVPMISADFKKYSSWKGQGEMLPEHRASLKKVINEARAIGKPMRFWGAPDSEAAWALLQGLGATVINTDKVKACNYFFKNMGK